MIRLFLATGAAAGMSAGRILFRPVIVPTKRAPGVTASLIGVGLYDRFAILLRAPVVLRDLCFWTAFGSAKRRPRRTTGPGFAVSSPREGGRLSSLHCPARFSPLVPLAVSVS